ncbi:MAG: hypothetical protein R2788_11030 [Saprospiraceae bacterium]
MAASNVAGTSTINWPFLEAQPIGMLFQKMRLEVLLVVQVRLLNFQLLLEILAVDAIQMLFL